MAYVSMGEAHRRITEYSNRFCDAVSYQDSSTLSRLLSFSSNSPSLLSLADALNVFQDASSLIRQSDKFSEYGEILAHLFRSLQSYRVGNLVEAYLAFEKFAKSFPDLSHLYTRPIYATQTGSTRNPPEKTKMDKPSFVIRPEEAETAAKQLGVSVLQLLPSLGKSAKSFARTPISKFDVGAVGIGSSGRIFLGVNVEFPNLPLHQSIHAEQFLVTNLTLNGERHLKCLAVSAAPCGHCRQFLQEIRDAPEIKILITNPNTSADSDAAADSDGFLRLGSLLPHPFGPDDLLEKDLPLLLDSHDNRLTIPDLDSICNGNTDSAADLKHTALAAANRSYAPYSSCPSGVSLVDCEGKVYRGWYMESAAYNPSMGPVQAALVDYIANGGGGGYERIVGAVLVEKEDAVVRQEHTARLLIQTISPKCDFKVFHCYGA